MNKYDEALEHINDMGILSSGVTQADYRIKEACLEALTKAKMFDEGCCLRVKPLNLEPVGKSRQTVKAGTAVGFYEIDTDGWIYQPFVRQCKNFKEAKQIVEEDYYSRCRTLTEKYVKESE